MKIIPVIDLRGGAVVRAAGGQRAAYRPIVTPLATSPEPAEVVAGFLRIYPFETIYAADLDAIEGTGTNRDAIAALAAAFPFTRFWVDAGASGDAAVRDWLAIERVDCVIGSESLRTADVLTRLTGEPRLILSLDFRGEDFLGLADLPERPDLWPARAIVMTLSRVGSSRGPDVERLAAMKARAPDRRFFAAGGVRGRDDLETLRAAGAAGALVASALHERRLTGADLAGFAQQKREP